MKLISYLIFIGLFVSLTACKSKQVQEEIIIKSGVNFLNNKTLSSVLDRAESENKLIFLDIYTDWCLPCKLMDEEVFTDKSTADFMNDRFLNYKVNAEKGEGPDLNYLYEVEVYPTLLFLDSKGRIIVRNDGAAFHTELKNLADQALMNGVVGCID